MTQSVSLSPEVGHHGYRDSVEGWREGGEERRREERRTEGQKDRRREGRKENERLHNHAFVSGLVLTLCVRGVREKRWRVCDQTREKERKRKGSDGMNK